MELRCFFTPVQIVDDLNNTINAPPTASHDLRQCLQHPWLHPEPFAGDFLSQMLSYILDDCDISNAIHQRHSTHSSLFKVFLSKTNLSSQVSSQLIAAFVTWTYVVGAGTILMTFAALILQVYHFVQARRKTILIISDLSWCVSWWLSDNGKTDAKALVLIRKRPHIPDAAQHFPLRVANLLYVSSM